MIDSQLIMRFNIFHSTKFHQNMETQKLGCIRKLFERVFESLDKTMSSIYSHN